MNTDFVPFDQLPEVEQDITIFSDVYKDVYGVRPRSLFEWFRTLSSEERKAELKSLEDDLVAQLKDEREANDPNAWKKYAPQATPFSTLAEALKKVA